MYWDLEVEGQFLENRLVFYVWIPIQRFRQIDSSLRTSSLSELKFSVFGMTGVYGDPSSFLPSHIKKLLIHRDDIFFPENNVDVPILGTVKSFKLQTDLGKTDLSSFKMSNKTLEDRTVQISHLLNVVILLLARLLVTFLFAR